MGTQKGTEICRLATFKFRNFFANKTSTALRIEADFTAATFGYRKRFLVGFCNACMLPNNILDLSELR